VNELIEPAEADDMPEGWEKSWDEVVQRGWQPTAAMIYPLPPARPAESAPPTESAPPAEEPPAYEPG
jgi:hypothetical protein